MGHAVNTYADVSSQGPQCSPGYFSLHKRFTVEGHNYSLAHLFIKSSNVFLFKIQEDKKAGIQRFHPRAGDRL
ncbi:hypothetical protein NSX61_25190, partial [Salmonella enterica]|nr:hypothetical protein [Salmonella enterica]